MGVTEKNASFYSKNYTGVSPANLISPYIQNSIEFLRNF